MISTRLAIICSIISLLAGCVEEPPPRSVDNFLENRILLEATMVRCGENRNQSKYEAECVNAREAINRLATEEDKAHREDLQAQFERKRKSLRRTQDAAAEARRRSAEARRRREEAQYLGVYEEYPPGTETAAALPPDSPADPGIASSDTGEVGQASVYASEPQEKTVQDLEAIREELQRRLESE